MLLGWVNELRNCNEVYSDSMPLTSIASGMTWEIDGKKSRRSEGVNGKGDSHQHGKNLEILAKCYPPSCFPYGISSLFRFLKVQGLYQDTCYGRVQNESLLLTFLAVEHTLRQSGN